MAHLESTPTGNSSGNRKSSISLRLVLSTVDPTHKNNIVILDTFIYITHFNVEL